MLGAPPASEDGGSRPGGDAATSGPPPDYTGYPGGYSTAINELPEGVLSKTLGAPFLNLLAIGLTTLGLLLLVPFWNAIVMLQDQLFVYFCGTSIPTWTIVMCVMVPLMYAGTIRVFLRRVPIEVQTEQTVLMIGNSFVCLIGVLVLFLSVQMRSSAAATDYEITFKPQYGAKSMPIYLEWQKLLSLRLDSGCATLGSVEECAGFTPSEYSSLLKIMEDSYACTGWGYSPGATATTEEAMAETPPVLFSQAKNVATCDGMTRQTLQHLLQDSADEYFYEGVYLVAVTLCIGFFKIVGFCTQNNKYSKGKLDGYGALFSAENYAADPGGRYVAGGVVFRPSSR